MMLRNMASMTALNLVKAPVQFLVNLMVAAAVAPEAFGLVTFTLPFIALIALLTDLGLGSALVREKTVSARTLGAAFTLMACLGVGLCAALVCLAPFLERHLSMAGLTPVAWGMAGAILLSVGAVAPRVALERSLRYRTIALAEALGVLIAAAAAGALLLAGAGIFALVGYQVTLQSVRLASFVWAAGPAVKLGFAWGSLVPLIALSGWILATNLFNFAARNVDNLLIGALLGSAALGLYGLGYQFMILPLMMISWPASGVLLASVTRPGVGEPERRDLTLGAMTLTALLVMPLMGALTFGLAWPVSAFMDAAWQDLARLVATLAPVGALQALAAYNGAVLIAKGLGRKQFVLALINGVVLVTTFLVFVPQGLFALVSAYGVSASLLSIYMIWLTFREIGADQRRAWLSVFTLPLGATALGLLLAPQSGSLLGLDGGAAWAVSCLTYALVVTGLYATARQRILRQVAVLIDLRAATTATKKGAAVHGAPS